MNLGMEGLCPEWRLGGEGGFEDHCGALGLWASGVLKRPVFKRWQVLAAALLLLVVIRLLRHLLRDLQDV